MAIKIILVVVTFLCLVQASSHFYKGVPTLRQESVKIKKEIPRIIVQRDNPYSSVAFSVYSFPANNCPSGQVWDSYQKNCRVGLVPYSLPTPKDVFDYEDYNDFESQR
jgi:hypothetical protein